MILNKAKDGRDETIGITTDVGFEKANDDASDETTDLRNKYVEANTDDALRMMTMMLLLLMPIGMIKSRGKILMLLLLMTQRPKKRP